MNKLRRWQHNDKLSSFEPVDDNEGYIEVKNISQVMTYEKGKVGFKTREAQITGKQKWILGPKDIDGWQTIEHSATGKFLTTLYLHPASYLSIENKGKLSSTFFKV